jgi:hypothetical protein
MFLRDVEVMPNHPFRLVRVACDNGVDNASVRITERS